MLLDDLKAEAFVALVNNIIANIDYSKRINDEDDCRTALQLIQSGAKLQTTAERHSIKGRSDLEATTKNWHWVFELKFHKAGGKSVDALCEEAKAQTIDRRYGERPYLPPSKRMVLVFDNEEQAFVRWAWVDANAPDISKLQGVQLDS